MHSRPYPLHFPHTAPASESGGIPRKINQICDMALFTGFCTKKKVIGEDIVRDVSEDLVG